MFFWADRYRPVVVPNFDMLGSLPYYALRVIEQLIIYGIPSFIFVSGFFIAISTNRSQKTVGWPIVINRVKNLVIPFLLWSVLILALRFFQGERMPVLAWLRSIVLGQATTAYYFVPVLVQLYLLAPFLVPMARGRWKLLLALTGMLQLVVVLLRYYQILGIDPGALSPLMFLTRSWFFPGYIFWFGLGIVIGLHLETLKGTLFRLRWVFLSGLAVFFIAGLIEWELLLAASGQSWIGPRETLIDNLYALCFLLSFIAFDYVRLPFQKQMNTLGTKSYGIYLAHSPVLEFTARAVYHLVPVVLAYQILFQPILYAAGLGIPLLMMAFVNRTPLRRYYNIIFG